MRKIAAIVLGMLTFVPSTFADTFSHDVYQCEAVLETRNAVIRSKFDFDGNSGGTSFNYIQSYNIRVYKQVDEDSPRIYLAADGSISGFFGSFGYPIYQNGAQSQMIITFGIPPVFGTTLKVICEKK